MRKAILRRAMRTLVRPVLGPPTPLAVQRRLLDSLARLDPPPRGVDVQRVDMAGVPALRVGAGEGALLYLHGGAFCIGSARAYRGHAARLSRALGRPVYLPDYRLAPEHPFPAGLDDVVTAYRWLIEHEGLAGAQVVVAGDSAGGGLTLSMALDLPAANLPRPAALVLLSPALDLTLSGASMRTLADADPLIRREWIEWAVERYCGAARAAHPRCSPLFADLTALAGLPPTLIQVGSDEVLLDDAVRGAARLRAARVDVTLSRFDGLWHVFQLLVRTLPEAQAALDEITGFVGRC